MSCSPEKRWVAFLRGMNLGGRRIRNDDLRACFVEMGLGAVSAFLASGNVVFEAAGAADDLGGRRIIKKESALGYAVPTYLRSSEEVLASVARKPFTEEELTASGGKPQVLLLASAPGAGSRKTVLELATDEDRLELHGRELYWLPAAGILDSELDLAAIERALGRGTMRSRRTLERLAKKYLAG
jgi:uncharacterized protein (DUF1697 family)